MTYTNLKNGLYQCNKCGKKIKELGWSGHNRWHRNQENKKSTQMRFIPMDKTILFKLFGEKAENTIKVLKENKKINYDVKSVEGRTVVEVWVR